MLHTLRITSLIDGISLLILMGIAMPLKYMWDMPLAVRIVGSLHGGIWLLLVALIAAAWWQQRLRFGMVALIMTCSVLPVAPFLIDARLRRLASTRTEFSTH